jgi:hypothetical protein
MLPTLIFFFALGLSVWFTFKFIMWIVGKWNPTNSQILQVQVNIIWILVVLIWTLLFHLLN